MEKISISIIIPVFNGLSYTQKCMAGLTAQIQAQKEEVEIHIVIVDDGSTDGTSQWIRAHYPEVYLVPGDGNLWWSGGINEGVKFALSTLQSDYILWWNNDVLADKDYFSNLVRNIQTYPVEVVMGSKIFMLDKGLLWGMGGHFDPRKGHKYMYGHGQKDGQEFQGIMEVDWFPGMGTVFHKSVFDKIGFLDAQNFPQYHGDSDFTYRAKRAGFSLMAFPNLILYNDNTNTGLSHRGSFKSLVRSLTSIKSNFNVQKNLLFVRKHASSFRAYGPMWWNYFRYIGGFFKWKALSMIGLSKKEII